MTPLFKRVLAVLWAGAGLFSLGSCGGGAEPAAPSLPQTISFSSPGEQRFGTLPAPLLATASSGLQVALASTTPAVCTVTGSRLDLLSVGTCTITAQQPGDATFAPAATLTSSFGVAMGNQTITFVAPGNQALNMAPAALVATASSGLPVGFASRTLDVCTVTGSSLTLLGLGTCTLEASQAGNANFLAAPLASQTFSVASGLLSQTINFAAVGNQTLGSPPPALAASASSGLAVSFVATTADTCSVSGTTLTLKVPGTCTVAASQAGDTRFAAAPAVINSFTILPTAQTISFTSPGNQTLGSPTTALAASASSGLPVSFASSTPDVCTNSGNTLVLVAAGTCTLRASQGGNANFAAAVPVSLSITVLATPQTITFAVPATQTLGSTPALLVASASSGLAVSLASASPAVCSVSGSTLTLLTAGTCTINASQAGNATFAAAAVVSRSFTVDPASQTITFAAPATQNLGSTPAALVATASSGLTVSLASTTPAVCTVSGSSLTLLTAGTCTVNANQAGNASFAAATEVARSFSVVNASQTISFTAPTTQTLGSTAAALVATASSGLTVSLASTTPTVCTVSGTALTLVAAGNCSVNASQAGNAFFAAAPAVAVTFAVVQASQTITFAGPANQTLGTAPPALLASASSGLPVSITSTSPGVCSVSGGSLTLLAVGTCSLSASQPGNAVFAAAAAVLRSFSVAAAPLIAQTISFASPGNQSLATSPVALLATASSGLAVTLSSSTPAVCTVSGSSLSLVAAGNCTLTASQAGNASFAAATPVSHTVLVSAATQSIVFNSPGNQTLGVAPAALSASASSGLAVAFASTTPAVCTVSGNTLTLVALGNCSISASQAGNGIYAAAVPVQQTFTVGAAPLLAQTISFSTPPDQTLGSVPAALVASASSGLTVSLTSTTPAVCTVSGSTLTLVAAGSCAITASQSGNATFAAATAVSRSFTVSKAAQTISFTLPATQTLGSNGSLVASASSGLPVAFASSTTGVCTVSGSTLTPVSAGTCTISASQAGNAIFAAAASVAQSFTVQLAPQSISFSSPGTQTMGSNGSLSASASSGLPVSFASSTTGVCTVSGSTLTPVAAGSCTIVASQAGNASFAAAASVSQTVTVQLAAQTISFTAPATQTVGSNATLSATASSGLTVSFASSTTGVCTVSGSTLTPVAAGTCTIDASQAGNGVFAAATSVSRSFTVQPAPLLAQTISFSAPATQTVGSTSALVASASSGLTVSFASSTTGVCTVSGSTLTPVSAGTCTITASQAGNATFAAAAPLVQSFTVVGAAQSITFVAPDTQTVGTTASLAATASSGLTVSFSSATPAVCSVSGSTLTLLTAGTCTINANQAGNGAFVAATAVSRSFTSAIEYFANGGFETVGVLSPALGWLNAASGYTRSTDSRSGGFSAQLASPAFSAAVMLQNSVEQGLRPALAVGESPTLTFWAKGTAGGTGNVLFALRYLDGVGNIKANSFNQFFHTLINPNTWTKITFNLGAVPATAVAAFIEFSQGIGPIDAGNPAGLVLIDDLSLRLP